MRIFLVLVLFNFINSAFGINKDSLKLLCFNVSLPDSVRLVGLAASDNKEKRRKIIITSDTILEYDLDLVSYYLPDKEGKFKIEDFLNLKLIINQPTKVDEQSKIIKHEGDSAVVQWFQFEIENNTNKSIEWFLDINWTDEIHAYEVLDGHAYVLHKNGALIKGAERDVQHKRRQWIKFISGKKSTTLFIVKLINTWDKLNPSARIFQCQPFYKRYRIGRYVEGVFLGIMILIVVTNLILFLSTKESAHLFYIFYVFWFTCFLLSIQGIMAEFFFAEIPMVFGDYIVYAAGGLTLLSYMLFVDGFLDLKINFPKWHKLLKILSVITFFVIGFLIFITVRFHVRVNNFFAANIIVIFLIVNIPAILKKSRSATLLLIGNVILCVGFIVAVTWDFSMLQFPLNYTLEISFISQVLIFSKGIGDRISQEIKEKQNAQVKALAVLEEKVQERTFEVVKQKELIEHKHKEITDSIRYAKRIQEAILPSMNAMHKTLKDGFLLYKPKDVVAGDFYWLEQYNGMVYFAAADCTGHGVPGAMVSVVCSNALTKSLLEENITETGKLLDRTREIVIERFSKSEEEVKDGMDISLCAINFNNMTLQWSGANNPLWILHKGASEFDEVKPDKQPIGMYHSATPFTTHEIKLQSGDTIYIFTDGYQDQFGGMKGKKYKAKQLKENLLAIKDKPMNDQRTIIDKEFEIWRGQLEQVDDVCIIGVRFA